MEFNFDQFMVGFLTPVALLFIGYGLFRAVTVEVEDETMTLITRFGRLAETLRDPGLHFLPDRLLPWVKVIHASMQRDFRHYRSIQLNDRKGTTLIVDLWIEFRLNSPERSLFEVENWEESLQSLLIHSATSALGTLEFTEILRDRNEIGRVLREDIAAECSRWGLEVETVMIREISLLPEVSRRMFGAVSARLHKAKADVEEEGRLEVAMLEASTSAKVAALVASAKGQYSAAIGRAYSILSKKPEILKAYQELYQLSLFRPSSAVTFDGFAPGEIRPLDAAMLEPANAGHRLDLQLGGELSKVLPVSQSRPRE
jgi:regulator of protease activity HflC (stomatin/prohibitin superfamily)